MPGASMPSSLDKTIMPSVQSQFGKVDARLALVRGVVARPDQAVVPHHDGMAGVAAAGQLEARLDVLTRHAEQPHLSTAAVVAAGGPHRAIRKNDKFGAADLVVGL